MLGIAGAIHSAHSGPLTETGHTAAPGLPPIETLTFESDYTVFMAPGVPPEIRRRALRRLWSFPVFNLTDDLLTYGQDYTTGGESARAHAMLSLPGQGTEGLVSK